MYLICQGFLHSKELLTCSSTKGKLLLYSEYYISEDYRQYSNETIHNLLNTVTGLLILRLFPFHS